MNVISLDGLGYYIKLVEGFLIVMTRIVCVIHRDVMDDGPKSHKQGVASPATTTTTKLRASTKVGQPLITKNLRVDPQVAATKNP